MVEADRLSPSILDIYKVFEHIDIIDMLSIGIQQQPSHTATISIQVGSDFWFLSHLCLWSQNDVNTLWSGIFAPPANVLGLSIEEKDLLFCTCIGRWPLPSQDAKVDLKALIVAVMPIYCLSETINLFFFVFLCVFNKLIIFSVS